MPNCGLCNEFRLEVEGSREALWGDAPAFYCRECVDSFNTLHDNESSAAEGQRGEQQKAPFSTKQTYSNGKYQGNQQYTYKSCGHNLSPMGLPDGAILYLSGSSHLNKPAQGPAPTAAVYLDSQWVRDLPFLTNDGTLLPGHDQLAVLSIGWPDMQAVPLGTLAFTVDWLNQRLESGYAVEIGCLGGHGRTGTLAAALLIKRMAWPAWKAAFYVRCYHCDKAIETASQEKLLVEYDTAINGTVYANQNQKASIS